MGFRPHYWQLPFNLTPEGTLLVLSLVPKVCIHQVASYAWFDPVGGKTQGISNNMVCM